ncbi:MAG: D-alanyl-D-alanine carboxypeptidase [Treponema sp.]|nr:D-alanyl-D-alanine carboxypeptidase [Treponema sp.]
MAALLFLIVSFIAASPLSAQELSGPAISGMTVSGIAVPPGVEAPALSSQAAVLMDAVTGVVLYNKNGDDLISPASLTKLMTMHIALEEIAEGRASLDEIVDLPRQSWSANQPPRSSLMFLSAGQRVSLRELLLGLAIPSGNDAAVAVALRFAPDIESFAERMNREGQRLGMKDTRFMEPSGISEYNFTTALEFAAFCREYLACHPKAIRDYHSVAEFAYPKAENVAKAYRGDPKTKVQYNRNTLLGEVEGVDGLKTGYIDEAGYNIALTAERRGTRFVAVILGAPASPGGDRIRDEDGRRLLEWGFGSFKTLRTTSPPPEPVRVWKGRTNQVELVPAGREKAGEDGSYSWTLTTYAGRGGFPHWETELDGPLIAPLPAGSIAGTLILNDEFGELWRVPLITAAEVEKGNFFKRMWDSIRLLLRNRT